MKLVRDYHPKNVLSIAEAFDDKLSFTLADGELERIKEKANKCSEMLGALVQMLHDKSKLTEADVIELIGYGYSKAEEP
jgi:hypothetical protein